MKTNQIIGKIRKDNDSKILTIPKKSNFQVGEYVIISKVFDNQLNKDESVQSTKITAETSVPFRTNE
jgi:hypothetical protein